MFRCRTLLPQPTIYWTGLWNTDHVLHACPWNVLLAHLVSLLLWFSQEVLRLSSDKGRFLPQAIICQRPCWLTGHLRWEIDEFSAIPITRASHGSTVRHTWMMSSLCAWSIGGIAFVWDFLCEYEVCGLHQRKVYLLFKLDSVYICMSIQNLPD